MPQIGSPFYLLFERNKSLLICKKYIKNNMNSPIRWLGSKKKISSKIISKFPKKFDTYFELFAGSAVILFKLEQQKSVISDTNTELIYFYKILRDSCEELIKEVLKLEVNEKTYYEIRNWDRDLNWPFSYLKRAVRFLYLNRTCFNGVWRLNSKALFNVPYGKRENVDYKIETLRQASSFLKRVKIYQKDFEFFNNIKSDDLVYLDPPYAVNSNSGESNYTKKEFNNKEQLRLFNFCKSLNKIGTKFVLSNSYSEDIVDLYKEFDIEIIDIKRCVGSLEKTRKMVQEVIITN